MDSNQPEQAKSKTSLLKLLLALAFFPLTLSYLILKQNKLPLIGRIAGIALLWVVFITIGASGSKTPTTEVLQNATVQANTPTPTVAITLEQKQKDFTELYKKYQNQSQAMITIQVGIQQLASLASNKEELYLTLEKLEKTQSSIAWSNLDIKTPESLKEYKQISDALGHFQIAGNNFTDAIKKMKEYVNKDDLEKLAQAKEQIDRGTARLSESKDLMDAVAKILEVDVSQIQGTIKED